MDRIDDLEREHGNLLTSASIAYRAGNTEFYTARIWEAVGLRRAALILGHTEVASRMSADNEAFLHRGEER